MYDVIKYSLKETFSLSILNGVTWHGVKNIHRVHCTLWTDLFLIHFFFFFFHFIQNASQSCKSNGFKEDDNDDDDKRRIVKIWERARLIIYEKALNLLCFVVFFVFFFNSFSHSLSFVASIVLYSIVSIALKNELIWVMVYTLVNNSLQMDCCKFVAVAIDGFTTVLASSLFYLIRCLCI